MIRYENDCVDCPQGCVNCGKKKTPYLICDNCEEESVELYELDGEQLCGICVLKRLKKAEI